MSFVCNFNQCSGCGLCVDICQHNAIRISDDLSVYNAVIQEDKCVSCNACRQACPNNHSAAFSFPTSWYQGWTEHDEIRKKASSGGFATAIAESFIKSGGIVCSCIFDNGKFVFDFAESCEDLSKFTGSKYVKSNPQGIYKRIKRKLRENHKVLFIGLPCQVAAVKRFIGDNLGEKLYTIDLICHGTPSPRLLDLFLNQYNLSLNNLSDISFRRKFKFQLEGDNKSIVTTGVSDRYSTAFLNGLTYTENCYNCPYAQGKRISDLTIGDSWGSELADFEIISGISLALCMTDKGNYLLKTASLHLEAVDLDKAIAHNHQLESPMKMPKKRKIFFDEIGKGKTFNSVVYKCLPVPCIRQDIKSLLIK
ncbi:MAG: Coenzyme F420 hydrogenase/dehydrogenase, beta subunit C-terminal domain, partial [Lachnospiraceae bacterium]|nr:Coenzyme F420 hydrogenase/dehydrogenase, beta subunit C-terminal domain [Lachnospiraceae bacterium]